MGDLATIIQRQQFGASAVATMGACPIWDERLARVLSLDALQTAEAEFGAYGLAADACALIDMELEQQFGSGWRNNPAALRNREQAFERRKAAEQDWSESYLDPLWHAQRDLTKTPAPSLAAAIFKAAFIEAADVENDKAFDADPMAILVEDFARFSPNPDARATWDALVSRYDEAEKTEPCTDEAVDEAGDLIEQIMDMPAPDAQAVRWKLDYVLTDRCGAACYTASYSANFVAQLVADYRRFLGEA